MIQRYASLLFLFVSVLSSTWAQPPCLTAFTTPAGQTQVSNATFTASVPPTTSVTLTMTTTAGSNLVTISGCNAGLITNLAPVSGPNVPVGTNISGGACGTNTVQLSQNATVTGSALHTFTMPGYTSNFPPTGGGTPTGLNCSVCPATFTAPACAGQYVNYYMCQGNIYTISMCGSGVTWDSYLAVTTTAGTALATGFPTSDDDGCGFAGGHAQVAFAPTASGLYRIRLWQDPCTVNGANCGTLSITCSAVPPPPPNDNPCNAEPLSVSTNCVFEAGNNAWATGTLGIPAPGCGAYANRDVWYSAVVPASGNLAVNSSLISASSLGIAVYTAPACNAPVANWALVACNASLPPSLLLSGLTGGSTVYIRVWAPNNIGQQGTFNICAFEPVPPQNDNPCGALNMPTPATCTPGLYNTTYATPTSLAGLTFSPAAPSCGGAANADVWFQVTVPASGAFTVNTFAGTLTDMAMAWYRLSPGGSVCNPPGFSGTMTQIACNDNQATGNNMPRINSQTATPNITPALVPGETIYIRVWPQGGNTSGTFELCVTESVPPPNDNPCGAIALVPSLSCNLVPTTNESASLTLGVPAPPCGAPVQNDVWYSAVVPPNGQLEFNTQGGSLTDAAFALYQVASGSCATSNLTLALVPPVNCQVGGSSFGANMPQQLFAGLTPGSTVYLRVWRQTGTVGSFNICARATAAAPVSGCDIVSYDSGGPTGNYGNNEIYEQTFCPEFPGDVVSIAWSAFSTQANTDFMTIYNGPSVASPVLGTYSGGTLPPGFVSTHPGGCITIRFTSNASVVSNGWALSISCGPPMPPAPAVSGVCGTTIYDPGGATGNYANNVFVTNTYCPTTPGEVVTLTFTQFATEQNFDFVTIFNGPDVTAAVMGTFSGTNLPGTFISTHPSGCLTVRFSTDGSIVSAGYAATIRCGPPQPPPPPPPPPTGLCGTLVFDPGGPTGNYFNGTNQNPNNQGGSGCWDPPGPLGPCAPPGPYPPPAGTWGQYWSQTYCPDVPGDAVTLSFTAFSIETGWDNVYIYNGPTVDPYNVNGTQFIGPAGLPTCGGAAGWCNQTLGPNGFTGNVIPGPFTSTHPSGCLTIAMTSDDIVNLPGWAATVQCQGAFNPNADCIYALRLYDIFGDGWAGSTISVTINGGSPSTYTIQAGTFNEVLIGLDAGDNVVITYNGVGYFATDNYWTFDLVGETYAVFHSAIPAASGTFNFTANCQPPQAPPQDCMGADIICSNGPVLVGGTHAGSVGDMITPATGCLTNEETEGNWYAFSTTAAGALGLTITPTVPGTNLDFALWGPFGYSLGDSTNWSGACEALSFSPFNTPLRCSFATATAAGGATGLNAPSADLSEGAGGDQFVQNLTVAADQVYMLYISNASRNNSAATITFSNTGILTCGFILPVELLEFDAKAGEAHVDVLWSTASEQNSAYYKVQRSSDGLDFHAIGHVQAAGSSQSRLDYLFKDESPLPGLSFYRLEQVDVDGSSTLSQMVPVEFNGRNTRVAVHPNPTRDVLFVTLDLPMEGTLVWTVTDQSGRRVMAGTQAAAKGTQRLEIHAEGLEAGAYQVDVRMGGTDIGRARFIKQ
jgi:hypothetical protein